MIANFLRRPRIRFDARRRRNQEIVVLGRLDGIVLAIGVVLGGAVLTAASVSAQTYDPNYPVCMTVSQRGGPHVDCSFTSIPQCKASGAGLAAQCDVNPFYAHEKRSRR
jgi:hypothetical protein